MELIGKLKEKVAKAKTNDEKKKLIEEAGIRLNTEELEKIGGGMIMRPDFEHFK